MLILKSWASPNYNDRAKETKVNTIILHYTAMSSSLKALEWLCNPISKVSSHYLIDEKGSVFLIVPEEYRAWHAGPSLWEEQADVNSRSIGIELAHLGEGPFPKKQIESLCVLLKDIVNRHKIFPSRILGHSDVAPHRKVDPGPWFPWRHLASQNLALWASRKSLRKMEASILDFQNDLRFFGYDCPLSGMWDLDTKNIRQAFLMRFYPELWQKKEDFCSQEHALLRRLISKKIEIESDRR